jgi:hypothetical protein
MPISDGWNNNSGIVNLSLFNLIIFIFKWRKFNNLHSNIR